MSIYRLLNSLGLTANYKGYFYLAYGVELCLERPERLQLVTKWVYPEVAKRYRTNWRAVERNIRSAGELMWERNRAGIEWLSHAPLEKRPSNSQLLAILSNRTIVHDA